MKKKFCLLSLIAILSIFIINTNVYAANIHCEALPNVVIDESIPDLVHTIILLIQIAVPVLLVVFGMMDFVKGLMSQKEDEIKKGQQVFIKRIIAAVLVFFVIAIVKFIISAVSGSTNSGIMDCANCFISGSSSSSCQKDGGSV